MGKQGPCYHCGVTSTPLWRNGPPDKPVLCNACGSRWRTKGSLTNYTPLHARSEPDDFEDHRVSRVQTVSIKSKETKLLKRKQNYDNVVGGTSSIMLSSGGGGFGGGGLAYDYHNQGFRKAFDEDTSNRSSSGSAMSNSDGYMQLGSADARRSLLQLMADHHLSKLPDQSSWYPQVCRRYQARNHPPTSSESLKKKRVGSYDSFFAKSP